MANNVNCAACTAYILFVAINNIYSFGVPIFFTLLDIYVYYYYQSAGGLSIYEGVILLLPKSVGLQYFDTDRTR
jgi:hypothetical protein